MNLYSEDKCDQMNTHGQMNRLGEDKTGQRNALAEDKYSQLNTLA